MGGGEYFKRKRSPEKGGMEESQDRERGAGGGDCTDRGGQSLEGSEQSELL